MGHINFCKFMKHYDNFKGAKKPTADGFIKELLRGHPYKGFFKLAPARFLILRMIKCLAEPKPYPKDFKSWAGDRDLWPAMYFFVHEDQRLR